MGLVKQHAKHPYITGNVHKIIIKRIKGKFTIGQKDVKEIGNIDNTRLYVPFKNKVLSI